MHSTKKTLLVGAVLAGISGAAYAETQVTLYGLIDAGVVYQNGKVGTRDGNRGEFGGSRRSRLGFGDGQQNGSRWGMRGTEDLGDGLQAVFVLEGGFSAGTGRSRQNDRLFGRQSTVGLVDRNWGELDLGRQTNIASKYFAGIDPFALDFLQASMGTAFSATNMVRYDNMVQYQTANWNGFQAGAGYSFSTDAVDGPTNFQNKKNNRAVTAGVRYSNGPLEVAVSYDQQFRYPKQPQPKQAIIGIAYDFEVVKLSAAYGWGKDGVMSGQDIDLVAGAPNPNTRARGTGATNDAFSWKGLKINSYMVGASVPIGAASKLLGSYQRADPNKNLDATDVYSLGYLYDLSKRTNLYAFASYANRAAFIDGNKMTTVGVGMRHRF